MALFGRKKKKEAEAEFAHAAEQMQQAPPQQGYPGYQQQPQQQPQGYGATPYPQAPPQALAPDSPLWQPIGGLGLDTYAQIAKYCATNGITDEQTMAATAEYYWHIPAQAFLAGVNGWVERMRQHQDIGQRFRQVYDAC